MIYISRDVYNRIWEYYLNVYRKYSNTWTYNKSITFFRWISSFCRAISSKSIYCKTPFLREWRRLGLTQIYFKDANWYFGFKEDGGDIYVCKCEYGDCMVDKDSNNASLNAVQPPKKYAIIGNAGYGFQIVKGEDGTFNYINSDGKLLYPRQWFKEVKPFKKTPRGILAFVNNNGICNAIDSNGTIYDMNRAWKDCFTEGKIKKDIMTEAINKISQAKRTICLTEAELKGIIVESVKQVLTTTPRKIGNWDCIPSNGYEFYEIPNKGKCVGIAMYVDNTTNEKIPPTYCLFRRGSNGKYFYATIVDAPEKGPIETKFLTVPVSDVPQAIYKDLHNLNLLS